MTNHSHYSECFHSAKLELSMLEATIWLRQMVNDSATLDHGEQDLLDNAIEA